MYYAAIDESSNIAIELGRTYDSFQGSQYSQGIFQFDHVPGTELTLKEEWDLLRTKVMQYGMINSLLIAHMPTASTSQILNQNECFEPFTSNLYSRRVLSGDFYVVNDQMVKDLMDRKLWTKHNYAQIMANRGSVQKITTLQDVTLTDVFGKQVLFTEVYKTVWEIAVSCQINMSVDRGAFIDQSQSFNLWMAEPTDNKLTNALFHGWKNGLKTGMYYLRRRAPRDPIAFTTEQETMLASLTGEGDIVEDHSPVCPEIDLNPFSYNIMTGIARASSLESASPALSKIVRQDTMESFVSASKLSIQEGDEEDSESSPLIPPEIASLMPSGSVSAAQALDDMSEKDILREAIEYTNIQLQQQVEEEEQDGPACTREQYEGGCDSCGA